MRRFANPARFVSSPVLQMALKAASIHLTSLCTTARVSMPHHCASRDTSFLTQLIPRQLGEDPCYPLPAVYSECLRWHYGPQIMLSDLT